MSASIKSNSSGNLELFSGSTKVLEADAGTGVVSGLKVAAGSGAGEAVNYDQVFGLGQTWQNVTASRIVGVTYTNTTGKPIMVAFMGSTTSVSGRAYFYVNDSLLIAQSIILNSSVEVNLIVPHNSTYKVTVEGGVTKTSWWELR
jgi:hypothetical protein